MITGPFKSGCLPRFLQEIVFYRACCIVWHQAVRVHQFYVNFVKLSIFSAGARAFILHFSVF